MGKYQTKTSAMELLEALKSREISAPEIVRQTIDKIKENEPLYNCYITTDFDGAMGSAKRLQDRIDAGENPGKLAGIPVAIKDNICVENMDNTCASRMLLGYKPPESADVVKKLKNAGAIMIGKTNMDEFAMGSTTETSYFGPTKNPYDIRRTPGGSSGGSAAAVALGETVLALGSDTGGSIRQPAAYCGVVGLKPTYGNVSRYGLVAYASSMDQIGPMGNTVEECALLYEVIAGRSEKDATSTGRNCTSIGDSLRHFNLTGLRIGVLEECLGKALDQEIKTAVTECANALEQGGAHVEMCHFHTLPYVVPAYYILADAEASSNLSRYDGVKYGYRWKDNCPGNLQEMYENTRNIGFGAEVKRRILAGTFVLSAGYYEDYYLRAQQVRSLVTKEFQDLFSQYDILITPVTPNLPPMLSESLADPLKMYNSDVYTVPANLAGLPALSLPWKLSQDGLPVGVQLMAAPHQEKTLLQVGHWLETRRN